jgi:hypothetical protein
MFFVFLNLSRDGCDGSRVAPKAQPLSQMYRNAASHTKEEINVMQAYIKHIFDSGQCLT